MVRPAFQRDNILNSDERAASARKCIALLRDQNTSYWKPRDQEFFEDQERKASNIRYAPSEPQLQWLRDMVERYAQ